MVDLTSRLAQIREMIDHGQYFTINRGRQYGKTTTLEALERYLSDEYIVVSLDFQFLSNDDFCNEFKFVKAFARELWRCSSRFMNDSVKKQISSIRSNTEYNFSDLFICLSEWCETADKKIVLIIDEVDHSSNNEVFINFLSQLRGYYLKRRKYPTFHSVILAGVHDIKNLREKIRPDEEHKHNSPWNIASDYVINMSFSAGEIAEMLKDYETDHSTGMDIQNISEMIYTYTSGYPVLTSLFCKEMSENFSFSKEGFYEAYKNILQKQLPLFDSLIHKIENDIKLRDLLFAILFNGQKLAFNTENSVIGKAAMYGFIKNTEGNIQISNRIFEVKISNWYISVEATSNEMYSYGVNDKNQFIQCGQLNVELILTKFVQHFNEIYGSAPDRFKESDGRKLFLMYLRPIINGIGSYSIESQTNDQKRMDIVINYLDRQYIIELKIWRGNEYNERGEQQLCDYLDYFDLKKGYMLSFNFNKNKQTGIKEIPVDDKLLVEAVV